MLYNKINTKYISNLLSVIYEPEKDKFIYLIMELGDLNTLMLKDEEDNYNYRHNLKLLEYVYVLCKNEYFEDFKNFAEIFQNENYIKDLNGPFPMINFNCIKFAAKKIFMKILFKEILIGLKHIHSKGISHRDLKPENIVYSSKDKCCKIIDFSISILLNDFDNDNKQDNLLTKEPGGSIHFQAPEQYEIKSHNPFVSDIWSLGITIFIFLFEIYPFDCEGDSELELQMNICNQKLAFPLTEYAFDINDNDSNKIVNFIESILEKDFSKRLSLDEIIKKLDEL